VKLFEGLAVLALAPASFAQDPPAPPTPPAAEAKKEIVRLTEWPKLEGEVASTVKTDIERLRKAGTEAMAEQAHAALVAVGAGIVPSLLPVVGRERDPEARARVEAVLFKVTTAEHTRLIAAFFTDKSREVRTWALMRCAAFPDAELAAKADEAFTKAKTLRDKDSKAEGAEAEVYAGALCATASGSHAGLELLSRYAIDQWGKKGVEMRAALQAVRDDESSAFASKLVGEEDRKKKVAGLNMLAGCGTKSALGVVKPCLDSTDNSIRIAAINAMRGIIDGDLPIANLPVFDAIELAKKWKARA
jgi:hypothetical protein